MKISMNTSTMGPRALHLLIRAFRVDAEQNSNEATRVVRRNQITVLEKEYAKLGGRE